MCSRLLLLLFASAGSVNGWGASAAASAAAAGAAIVKDYSSTAAGLFNNMRTPAALIGGAIVPVGILTAPKFETDDSKRMKLLKAANVMLGVASLQSEILAITHSTIAINKLAEVTFPPTAGVAELIQNHHELAWLGTNVHFLLGMFGFGILVGAKPYWSFGRKVGNITLCWTAATMLLCVSVVNRGIALGHGTLDQHWNFANNLFTLTARYVRLTVANSTGVLPILATGFILYSLVLVWQHFMSWNDPKEKKA